MKFLINLVISALSIIITGYLLEGVYVEDFLIALVIAGLLSLLNATVRPLLVLLTIPITIFTLGIFLLFINAFMVVIADYIIDDFTVVNYWWALGFSLIVAVLNSIFQQIVGSSERSSQ